MEEGSPMIAARQPAPLHLHPEALRNPLVSHPRRRHGQSLPRHLQRPVRLPARRREVPTPATYDQEIFLAIHHWEPSFVPMVETMRDASSNQPLTTGSDVGYQVRHHQPAHARRRRAHPRQAGPARPPAPAQRQRHRERGPRSARPHFQSRRHGRQPRPNPPRPGALTRRRRACRCHRRNERPWRLGPRFHPPRSSQNGPRHRRRVRRQIRPARLDRPHPRQVGLHPVRLRRTSARTR